MKTACLDNRRPWDNIEIIDNFGINLNLQNLISLDQ